MARSLLPDNWADPNVVEELAVDSRKVEEVKSWLLNFKNKCGVLLLTGPTGCGKTTTIRCLAKCLGFHLREWVTPLDRDFESDTDFLYSGSQVEKFDDFLYTCSRYSSLFNKITTSSSLLLVEDYPNVFLKNSEAFHNVLMKYCSKARSPLIFICSKVADQDLNLEYNLFPAHILLKLGISQISFNPVTKTKMMTALKRMGALLHHLNPPFKIPPLDVISEICSNANGDVRFATLLLQMKPPEDTAALFDMAMKPKPRTQKSQKSKTFNKYDGKSALCEKDDRVGLLHGVGRVLFPKWSFSDDLKLHHSSKRQRVSEEQQLNASKPGAQLVHSPLSIVDSFLSISSKFMLFVHENYLNTFSKIDSVAAAALCLSQADIVMTIEGYERQHDLSLDLGVRGVMVHNYTPVRAWNSVKSPKYYGILQTQKEILNMTEAIFKEYPINLTTLMMDYFPYMSHLNLSLSHDQKQLVANCASMEPLAKFCETFKSLRHVLSQQTVGYSKAYSLITQEQSNSSALDVELHISEDESEEELDEGSQNLSMLVAALQEDEQDYRELLNDSDSDILLSQL